MSSVSRSYEKLDPYVSKVVSTLKGSFELSGLRERQEEKEGRIGVRQASHVARGARSI